MGVGFANSSDKGAFMKSLRRLSRAGFLVLALLAACFSTRAASGQNSKGQLSSWDNLKSLRPGQEIRVVTNNVKSYQGEFESLSEAGITLRQRAGEQTLARKDVFRVSQKIGQDHGVRNALIGTVVGAGAGLGIGLAVNNVIWSHTNCTLGPLFHCGYPPNPHWGIILTPAGGLAGAVIGAAMPTRAWHDLYRAR
jgi:hypothetical protein